jgi:1-acyl-sn-glycerol-3-phosphate acyltransferase
MADFYYHFVQRITHFIPSLGCTVEYDGLEHVPASGPALLLSNHISHFDPSFLSGPFPRLIHFMADKPLLEIPVYGWLMRQGHVFPIDRTKNDRAAVRTTLERLDGGNIVGIFPEKGIRHGKTSVLGGAEMPAGTASLWKLVKVPVIPVIIIGTDQLYAWKNYLRRPKCRVFVRVGPMLPAPEKTATREELRDRIVASWRAIFENLQRDYQLRPDELPQSAQERWGRPAPPVPQEKEEVGAEN